jgi:Rad51
MALFRVDFSGRGELSERQQKVIYLRFFYQSVLYLLVPSQLAQVRSLAVGAM